MPYNEAYNIDPAVGQEGQVSDTEPAVIVSRTVETAAGIAFGRVVMKGTADRSAKADISTAAIYDLLGISVRSQATGARASTPDIYPVNDTAAIMKQGVIWVKVSAAVVAKGPVWLDKTTGNFLAADPGTSKGLRLVGCSWESTAAINGLARLRVNFDVPAVAGA